jgi:hypothetical protein
MNRPVSVLCLLLLLFLPVTGLSQERSDYEIQQSFVKEYSAIMKGIEGASSVVECVDLELRIAELDSIYAPHRAMLNKALYPEGFQGRLDKARGQLALTKDKLNIIETQYDRIVELETQVKALSEEVARLSGENSGLLAELERLRATGAKDKTTIDSLNAMVISLKRGLRERDEMIFALVDSLFLQYGKDVEQMQDREKSGAVSKLERRNVLTNVKKAIEDNLKFLAATELRASDVASVAGQQQQFASKWKGLGPKLTALYMGTGAKGAKELAAIDTMLTRWDRSVDAATWRVLNGEFSERGLAVQEFQTGQQFYDHVVAFVDSEIVRAREKREEGAYQVYSTFVDSVWNPLIKKEWMPVLLAGGKLRTEQQEAIEARLAEWESAAGPPATLSYVVIILIILVVALSLYGIYRRRAAPGASPPAA